MRKIVLGVQFFPQDTKITVRVNRGMVFTSVEGISTLIPTSFRDYSVDYSDSSRKASILIHKFLTLVKLHAIRETASGRNRYSKKYGHKES